MIYIIDKNGNPLMPTERHGKVRRLLNDKKAKVIKQIPFTIKLLYDTTDFKQPIILGVDAGNIHVGLSAVANNKELYSGEHILRSHNAKDSVTKLLETRKELRRGRRHRKTRYRPARFNNRKRKPTQGYDKWFTPTTRCHIAGHEHAIKNVAKILPISDVIIECGAFDTQLLKNPDIKGIEYQQGELSDWDANLREYIIHRDEHTCQYCGKNSFKDNVILQTHHIIFRSMGGSNMPNNLITLCIDCHKKLHEEFKRTGELPKFKIPTTYKDETYMSTMRWALYGHIKQFYYPDLKMTFGYKTKKTRIDANRQHNANLEKTSPIDARCITGYPLAKPLGFTYKSQQKRCHDRALYATNPMKIPKTINKNALIKNGGYFKSTKVKSEIHGFRYSDIIQVNNDLYIVVRRQEYETRTQMGIKPWNNSKGTKKSISSNKCKLIARNPDRFEIIT